MRVIDYLPLWAWC